MSSTNYVTCDYPEGESRGCLYYFNCLKTCITRAFSIKCSGEKAQTSTDICIGVRVQTRRGVGEVRSISTYYSPVLVDIFYGDNEVGYCFLSDTQRPGWGRCGAEECQVVTPEQKRSKD